LKTLSLPPFLLPLLIAPQPSFLFRMQPAPPQHQPSISRAAAQPSLRPSAARSAPRVRARASAADEWPPPIIPLVAPLPHRDRAGGLSPTRRSCPATFPLGPARQDAASAYLRHRPCRLLPHPAPKP
jgi:hypothetical protein